MEYFVYNVQMGNSRRNYTLLNKPIGRIGWFIINKLVDISFIVSPYDNRHLFVKYDKSAIINEMIEDRKIIRLFSRHKQRNNSMRNITCTCGSGLKFKKCCWWKYRK